MNIFGSIVSKIFGHSNANAAQAGLQANAGTSPLANPAQQTAAQPAQQQAPVNVDQILASMAQQQSQKLNWQASIVDLLKLLGLDSGLESRKSLARELGYTGDTADSAKMNVWLSHEVMAKLAQNGGHVPDSLKH